MVSSGLDKGCMVWDGGDVTSHLDTVRGNAVGLEQAKGMLRDSIYLACLCGERVADVAAAAGVTRQRVYQVIGEMDAELDRMRERVAEIDRRYDKLVDVMAEAETLGNLGSRELKAVTGLQNGVNGKRRRSGRGDAYSPLAVSRRGIAESKLLRVLEDRRDEPVIRDVVAQLDEAAILRQRLAAFDDARAFGEII